MLFSNISTKSVIPVRSPFIAYTTKNITCRYKTSSFLSAKVSITKSTSCYRLSLTLPQRECISLRQPTAGYGTWIRQNRYISSGGKNRIVSDANAEIPNATRIAEGAKTSDPVQAVASMTMWQRFLAPKPMPERHTMAWYREIFLICTVFAITGSTTMLIVRPAVSDGLGIKGNLIDGPWSYRICSLVIMTPVYATLLVAVGTIFGRHAYFRHFSVKIFSRFGIPPELMDATYHETKNSFRKW